MNNVEVVEDIPAIQKSNSNLEIFDAIEFKNLNWQSREVPEGENEFTFSILNKSPILRFDFESYELYDLEFDISEKAMDLARVKSGTALFFDAHDSDRQIGKILDAWIEKDEVHMRVRVGDTIWGEDFLRKRKSGIEPGKSIEVRVTQMETISPAEYNQRRVIKRARRRATAWEIQGVSTVGHPAFGTVGFSRAFPNMEMFSNLSAYSNRLEFLESQLESLMTNNKEGGMTTLISTENPIVQNSNGSTPAVSIEEFENQAALLAKKDQELRELQSLLRQQEISIWAEGLGLKSEPELSESLVKFLSELDRDREESLKEILEKFCSVFKKASEKVEEYAEGRFLNSTNLHESFSTFPGTKQSSPLGPHEIATRARQLISLRRMSGGQSLAFEEAIALVKKGVAS